MSNIIVKERKINEEVYPILDEIKILLRAARSELYDIAFSEDDYIYRRILNNVREALDEIGFNIYTIESAIEDKIYEAHVIQKKMQDDPNYNLIYGPPAPGYLSAPLTLSSTVYNEFANIELIDRKMPNHVKYDFFENISKDINGVLENIEKCCDLYIYGDKFDKYKEFRSCLIEDKFVSKPCRDTSFATQGVCEVGNMTFITSYDTGYAEETAEDGKQDILKSRLDIIGEDGEAKMLYFPHTAHVGGIGYCDDLEMIYVCGEGGVEYYSIEQLAKAANKSTISPDGKYEFAKKNGKGNNAITKASFLTTNKNDVWVGEFQYAKDHKLGFGSDPELMRYETDELGNLIPKEMYTLPYRNVQGMCITEYEGKEYFIFSTSEGRDNHSYLKICTMKDGEFDEKGELKMPCLSEQVSLTEDGNLMIIFESDCDKYGEGADKKGCATKQVGNVCYLDLEEVMSKCM